MAFRFLAAAVVHALLGFKVGARRVLVSEVQGSKDDPGEQAKSTHPLAEMLATRSTICGDNQIGDELGKTDLNSARTLPWGKVRAIADHFIKTESANIRGLEAEVDYLIEEIKKQEALEVSKGWSEDEIRQTVESAIAAPSAFGSLQTASDSLCGRYKRHPQTKKRLLPAQSTAYDTSISEFEKMVSARFDRRNVRTSASEVQEVCEKVLPADDDGLGYCKELCTALSRSAADISDKAVGIIAGRGSDLLKKELSNKIQKLDAARAAHDTCTVTLGIVDEFQKELQPLETAISDALQAAQKARSALDEAEDELEDLEDTVSEQEKVAEAAAQRFTETTENVKLTRKKLLATHKGCQDLGPLVKKAVLKSNKATAIMEVANSADKAAKQLKAYVSQALLSMEIYFDTIIRAPLRRQGLDKKNFDEVFARPVMAGESFGHFEASMSTLHKYCDHQFSTVQSLMSRHGIDLTPLCKLGNQEETVKNVGYVVKGVVEETVADLKDATVWLNKWHMQDGMTDALAADYVAAGEPIGLRAVLGPLKTATTGYLADWRKDGPFLQLLAKLGEMLGPLDQAAKEMKAALDEVTEKLRQLQADRAAYKEALATAVKDNELAGAQKLEAEKLLEAQRKEAEEAAANADDLQAKFDLAWRLYQEARVALQTAFKAGVKATSFLETRAGRLSQL